MSSAPANYSLERQFFKLASVMAFAVVVLAITIVLIVTSDIHQGERKRLLNSMGASFSKLVAHPLSTGNFILAESYLQGIELPPFVNKVSLLDSRDVEVASHQQNRTPSCGSQKTSNFPIANSTALAIENHQNIGKLVISSNDCDLRQTTKRFIAGASFLGFIMIAIFIALSRMAVKRGITPLKKAIEHSKTDIMNKNVIEAAPKEIRPLLENILSIEKKLIEQTASAKIGEAACMIAHDVKGPFNQLFTFIESLKTIKDSKELSEIIEAELPQIESSYYRVVDMLEDIRQYNAAPKIRKEPTSIEALVNTSLRQIKHYPNSKLDISVEQESQIDCDRLKIERIMCNLLRNAFEATQEQQKVWVKSELIGKDNVDIVKIIVGNSGSYIDANALELIFEPSYTKGKENGSGLGLAIAKKFVEAHDGKIWCESDKNTGTEFIFTIPQKRQSLSVIASNRIEAGINFDSLKKVLIVDDEPAYANAVAKILKYSLPNAGEDTYFEYATNDTEVEEQTKSTNFDLIIMDIDLGQHSADGLQITKILREHQNKTQIIVHSSNDSASTEDALASGANAFLAKPMTLNKIRSVMNLS